MNLLLVGGTGVLSKAVAQNALQSGFQVTMINRGKRPVPDGAELLVCDCHRHDAIASMLSGRQFDAVIDFLCYTTEDVKASFRLYSKYCSQYMFISSCAVYDTRQAVVMTEDSPKGLPIWKYSVDKWNCEVLLAELAADSSCRTTVIRPSVTYGDTRIPYGIMPPYGYHWTLPARILAGKPIVRWNGGVNRCNMMRVEDFAVGCVGLVGNPRAYGEAFNVCGDETPSFNDVISVLCDLLGKKAITVDVESEFFAKEYPSKAGEILGGRSLDSLNSNAKIKQVVPGFKQTIGLREGIARTLDAYKAQNYQHGIDWKFDAEMDRIIRKWCNVRRIKSTQYKLGFCDYLGTASLRDRKTYYETACRESMLFRAVSKLRHLLARRRLVAGPSARRSVP